MATAFTVTTEKDLTLTCETPLKVVFLNGPGTQTYTPSAITGKTVRFVMGYNSTGNTAVTASVSNGVITVGNALQSGLFTIVYTYE
jgi:hypothetical protein